LQRIDIDELFDNSSNRGMLSFLERPPEEAQARLREKQRVNAADSRRLMPVGELPPGRESPLSMTGLVSFADIQPTECAAASLPQVIESTVFSSPLPDSRLLPDSNVLPDSSLLPANKFGNCSELRHISRSIPDSSLLPDSNFPPDSNLPQTEEPVETTQPSEPGSNLLPGCDLQTANGRTVRIRPARSVQDAHTNGEHLLLTAMWKKGSPESDDTRLLRAGLAELSRWTGSHKTSCRAYIRALIAKLALEEAETFNASAGSDGARVYRIFSFNTILDRRRRTNLTHVIRTGAVWFVDPRTGEKLTPDSNLLSGSNLPPDSNLPPASGSNHPPAPGSNQPPLNKNREEVVKQTTATAVAEALSSYGPVDNEAITRLVRSCKEQTPDCTEQEISHFIHEKGRLVKARESRIQNPIGFLIDAVPKCFAGETFRLWRQTGREAPATGDDDPNDEERDRAWGREHEAELNDPTVPEEVKRVIRKCLGLNS
jgi:hypothetical protein